MKDFTKQFKKDAEHVRLTETEKSELLNDFHTMMQNNPMPYAHTPVRSPFMLSSFTIRRYAYAALSMFLIVGLSTSYAAEFTEPGDILYPVKTFVNDTAITATAFSSEAKVEAKIKLVERRVKEMQELVEDGDADQENLEYINKKIEEYSDDVNEVITESIEENDVEEIEEHKKSLKNFEKIVDEHRVFVETFEKKKVKVTKDTKEDTETATTTDEVAPVEIIKEDTAPEKESTTIEKAETDDDTTKEIVAATTTEQISASTVAEEVGTDESVISDEDSVKENEDEEDDVLRGVHGITDELENSKSEINAILNRITLD